MTAIFMITSLALASHVLAFSAFGELLAAQTAFALTITVNAISHFIKQHQAEKMNLQTAASEPEFQNL
jgi:hypothetical protein